jgi:hypothetical protein
MYAIGSNSAKRTYAGCSLRLSPRASASDRIWCRATGRVRRARHKLRQGPKRTALLAFLDRLSSDTTSEIRRSADGDARCKEVKVRTGTRMLGSGETGPNWRWRDLFYTACAKAIEIITQRKAKENERYVLHGKHKVKWTELEPLYIWAVRMEDGSYQSLLKMMPAEIVAQYEQWCEEIKTANEAAQRTADQGALQL